MAKKQRKVPAKYYYYKYEAALGPYSAGQIPDDPHARFVHFLVHLLQIRVTGPMGTDCLYRWHFPRANGLPAVEIGLWRNLYTVSATLLTNRRPFAGDLDLVDNLLQSRYPGLYPAMLHELRRELAER